VAYLPLDRNTYDYAGKRMAEPVNIEPTDGKVGGAYRFGKDSSHSYIRLRHGDSWSDYYEPEPSDFCQAQEISVFAWVSSDKDLSDLGSEWDSYIAFKPRSTFVLGWSGWSHDGWECSVWNQSRPDQRAFVWKTMPQKRDQWVHLGCVYDGDELRLYIDGKLAASKQAPGYVMQADPQGGEYYDWFIGSKNQYVSADLTWEGIIDEVMIYCKVLSERQVARLYRSQLLRARQWK
jgi:hypothetical protein